MSKNDIDKIREIITEKRKEFNNDRLFQRYCFDLIQAYLDKYFNEHGFELDSLIDEGRLISERNV